MYWLAEICVRRPVFALMIVMALVVAGLAAFPKLGVDRFPSMDMPTIYVRTTYPGAAGEEVESEVSQPIEDAVATVAGIDELRSISRDGQSFVIVTFNLTRNLDAAVQDVRDAVSSILNRLPPGIDPPVVMKQDMESSPILTLAVSGPRSSRELFLMADRFVKNVIESAPGVGQVSIVGAADRAVQVKIDARRLAAHQLSILDVREALVRQNAEVPGGMLDEGLRERNVRTLGRVAHSRDFPDLVVESVNGRAVRLSDLGEVADDTKEVRTLARLNGKPAVVVQVQRQSGENTVQVIEAIKGRLPRCRAMLPDDVDVMVIQDQSRYILAALHEIEGHLISGSILACITVLLFMRSWRSTLIAAVAIPASIIATFAFMRAFGFTLNNVTMLALVLMVGVVIDDAIVVLENVFHCIEEKGLSPAQAAVEGTREIGPAVLATTISLVIVFLPVSFLSSVTGRMLFQFGVTATVAILVSMLVSFTLTPMMCSKLLTSSTPNPVGATGSASAGLGATGSASATSSGTRALARDLRSSQWHGRETVPQPSETVPQPSGTLAEPVAHSRRGFYRWIESGYLWCLQKSMRHRWLVLLLAMGVIASNVPLYYLVQQDYIPTNVDESEFEVRLQAREGASLASMDETIRTVEAMLHDIPGIETVLTAVGTRGFGGVNRGELFVRLTDIEERTFSLSRFWRGLFRGDPGAAFRGNFTQREKMAEIRSRLKSLSDVTVSVRNLTSLRQGAPVDIDFSITGPDIAKLAEFSDKLLRKAEEIPGIVDLQTTLRLDKPELLVKIDRERAAALGVEVREIADTLRVAVGGDDRVSRYRDVSVDDAYDVELRLVGIDRRDVQSVSQLYVRANPSLGRTLRSDMGQTFHSGQSGNPQSGHPAGRVIRNPQSARNVLTRIDNVVTFEFGEASARIDRLDRQRMVAVRANLAGGYALADRIAALQQAADEIGVPLGFETRVMGGGRELERTLQDFVWTFVLSFIFMYIVLAAQYEHLIHPFTILLSLPLAVPFGIVSLLLGGETLNLYSAMGILVLFGVVKKASILQVDHTNALRRQGMDRLDAILQANRDRLRPILMTTISFVAGLLPLLIGTGPGAEERRSIAVLAVGGQTLSLLLTLLAIPVIYSYLDDLSQLAHGLAKRFSTKPAHTAVHMAPTAMRSTPSAE